MVLFFYILFFFFILGFHSCVLCFVTVVDLIFFFLGGFVGGGWGTERDWKRVIDFVCVAVVVICVKLSMVAVENNLIL